MPNVELDASNIPTLMKCRGNYRFLGLPKPDLSEAQKEGALAFIVLVNVLKGEQPSKGLDGHDIDQEMIDFANMTASKIMEDEPRKLHFEDPLVKDFFTEVDTKAGKGFVCHKLHARPNIWYYDKEGNIVIVDYKYGRKVEEVVKNWRLISQALALWCVPGRSSLPNFKLVIAQPRASHHLGFYRSWTVGKELLADYMRQLSQLFAQLYHQRVEDVSGSHCVYCPGFSKCQVANDTAINMVEVVKKINSSDLELTNKQKAVQLELIDEIFTFLKQKKQILEEQILETIKSGTKVPGWKTEGGRGSYEWAGPEEEVRKFFKLLVGKDPVVPKLMSPNECSKKFNIPRKVVNKFTNKLPGKPTLVRTSIEEEAAQIFSNADNKQLKQYQQKGDT